MPKDKNKVLGALLGVAIGDALGGPVEFMSAEEVREEHGGPVREMIGGGWLNLAPGEITDDTQMTLCVAEGIAEGTSDPIPNDITAIGRRFIEWYDSNPKDIGNCCRAVIGKMRTVENPEGRDWLAAAEEVTKSSGGQTAGNGALMRAVYPALYYGGWPFSDETTGPNHPNINDIIGRMTHSHEASRAAVRAYARFIAYAIPEVNIEDGETDIAEDVEARSVTLKQMVEEIKQFITDLKPDGYAPNSLMCAIKAVYDTYCFEGAIVYAINLGGDADTIGAITGGLAGAIYGADEIPPRWVSALEPGLVQRIEELATIAAEKNHIPCHYIIGKTLEIKT